MDSDRVVLQFTRESYVQLRTSMAAQPWETLGSDLLVKIAQLTRDCKSWLLPTPEINGRSVDLWRATRAWCDLAALKEKSEWVRTDVELRRAWAAFFAAGKKRCKVSEQNRFNEARLDAQVVTRKTPKSLLPESEHPKINSLLHDACSQRFTHWEENDLYPNNTSLAHDKWLASVYLLAEDPRDPNTIPDDPAAQIRRIIAWSERYHGDVAAATAPLLNRINAEKGAGRSIAWRSVDPLGSKVDELVAPANIESQAMVNRDWQRGREKTSLTDDEWRVLDARMAYPEIPFWGAEMPKVVGLSAERIESINKSLESDRPAGREIYKRYDIYLPPAKRQY